MQLQNGRPENTDGRLDKEIRVYDFLDKLGVEYQRVDHEAAGGVKNKNFKLMEDLQSWQNVEDSRAWVCLET